MKERLSEQLIHYTYIIYHFCGFVKWYSPYFFKKIARQSSAPLHIFRAERKKVNLF